jgi:predicted DNA-binding transcriptional regulator AlpA
MTLKKTIEELRTKGAIEVNRNQNAAIPEEKPKWKKKRHHANADGVPRTGVLRRSQVMSMFGISDATLRRRVREGVIPRPLKNNPLGNFRIWKASEVWNALECIGDDNGEIAEAK